MGKKLIACIMSLTVVCTLCVALVGCGANDKANFVGEWELESMETPDEGNVDISGLKLLGITPSIMLNEDGSGSFNLFGEALDATWKVDGGSSVTMSLSGAGEATFTLADERLTYRDGATVMTFARQQA